MPPLTETKTVTLANGLAFEVDQCGSGDVLVLCLHGFPESKFSWRFQMPMLAEMGYRVWAPNLRGYGASARPKGARNYRIDRLVEDVEGLIAASGTRETIILSHDWGGIIAWQCAIRKIRTLTKLIVCNCPHPQRFRDVYAQTKDQKKRSWYVKFFQIPWLPEFLLRRNNADAIRRAFVDMAIDKSRFPKDVTDHYRANALIPGAMTAMLNYYRAIVRYDRKNLENAPVQVDVPTLLIWGEEDTALSKATAEGTDAYVKDLTTRFIPRVSHWVQQEAPEPVNAMIAAWLSGKPVPEAGAL